MTTRVPNAWETSWAQEAIQAERDRPSAEFQYPGADLVESGEVVFLSNADGQCRAVDAALVQTEHWRVQDVRDLAAVPSGCSGQIASSPGLGALAEFREGYWTDSGPQGEWRDMPYRAGCAARTQDAFDTMTAQAMRRGGRAPFTLNQVDAGRAYRDLFQRVASAGIKCSKAFDQGGGKGRVDFMDAYACDVARLRLFQEAIGDGVAKDTKRFVAAIEAGMKVGDVQLREVGRNLITVREVVDEVCIHERALSAILQRHGWSASGKNRNSLRDALCAALGRMQGI